MPFSIETFTDRVGWRLFKSYPTRELRDSHLERLNRPAVMFNQQFPWARCMLRYRAADPPPTPPADDAERRDRLTRKIIRQSTATTRELTPSKVSKRGKTFTNR